MSKLEVLGDSTFLLARLNAGEKLFARPDALIQSDEDIQLQGRTNGGMFRALVRNLAHGQSYFQQHILAKNNTEVILGADVHDCIEVLNISPSESYMISDGVFLACTDQVHCQTVTQGIFASLFGGNGGFLIMEVNGNGQLAISSFGDIAVVDVSPDKYTFIDNGHVLAWSKGLETGMSMHNKGSNLISGLWNSTFSKEGLMMQFRGHGKVYFASKKPSQVMDFIASSSNQNQPR